MAQRRRAAAREGGASFPWAPMRRLLLRSRLRVSGQRSRRPPAAGGSKASDQNRRCVEHDRRAKLRNRLKVGASHFSETLFETHLRWVLPAETTKNGSVSTFGALFLFSYMCVRDACVSKRRGGGVSGRCCGSRLRERVSICTRNLAPIFVRHLVNNIEMTFYLRKHCLKNRLK